MRGALASLLVCATHGGAWALGEVPWSAERAEAASWVSGQAQLGSARAWLSQQGYRPVGTFDLPAGADDLCLPGLPTFPRSLPAPSWMVDADGPIECWDGPLTQSIPDGPTFLRVCMAATQGRVVGSGVAAISTDLRAGTWEGGLLPEDWFEPCEETVP